MELINAKGTKDLMPEEKIVVETLKSKLVEIFERYGFNPLETPLIEKLDVLSSKYAGGDEILKEIFVLTDQGNRKLGLRYDLTVPLSRVVGMNPNLKMPFKRYQLGKVFRDGPIKAGRYREFIQCDVDTVGSSSMLADAEFVAIVRDFFRELNVEVVTKVNTRKLLNGIIEEVKVPDSKKMKVILAIDKLEKQGINVVRKELEDLGISDDRVCKIEEMISIKGNNSEKLEMIKKFVKNKEGLEGIKELEEIANYLKLMKVDNYEFDFSLARGLAYYTGTVFEVFAKKSKVSGALAAGGRYDRMIAEFLGRKEDVPAVGISFGVSAIMDAVEFAENKKCVTQIYVIPIGTLNESVKIVNELRGKGLKVDVDLMSRGVSKNLNYANSYKIPFVAIIGEKELKQKRINLRDMKTGKEQLVSVKDVADFLKK
ncbi:MAG: histidine--tRNA ligase [Candidatus Diapherotrites archaeon]